MEAHQSSTSCWRSNCPMRVHQPPNAATHRPAARPTTTEPLSSSCAAVKLTARAQKVFAEISTIWHTPPDAAFAAG